MRDADALNLPATLVHVSNREADTVFHFRQGVLHRTAKVVDSGEHSNIGVFYRNKLND